MDLLPERKPSPQCDLYEESISGKRRNIHNPSVISRTPGPRPSFLDLPGELRNRIYEYIFLPVSSRGSTGYHDAPGDLPILLACRQIYHEVHILAFASVRFDTSKWWNEESCLRGQEFYYRLRILSPKHIKVLKSLVISSAIYYHDIGRWSDPLTCLPVEAFDMQLEEVVIIPSAPPSGEAELDPMSEDLLESLARHVVELVDTLTKVSRVVITRNDALIEEGIEELYFLWEDIVERSSWRLAPFSGTGRFKLFNKSDNGRTVLVDFKKPEADG